MLGRAQAKEGQRGDTIIEVLFAMTILAMVVTITINLMNNGFASMMSSMDRTNVQAIMNGQAALLRASRDKAVEGDTAGWNAIKNSVTAPPLGYSNIGTPAVSGCTPAGKRFYFDPGAAEPWEPVDRTGSPTKRAGTYPVAGDGIWIEAYKIDPDGVGTQPNYYDFYIKSCWRGYGSNIDQEAKVIVRLYEI